MIMKWMEVYIVARTGRPKSDNPKKSLIGLKLTEEEAAKLREYASKHDMTKIGRASCRERVLRGV